MIATATASSTSENPLLLLIAPGSRRNDHHSVVDRGGRARPVLVHIVAGCEIAGGWTASDVEVFSGCEIAVLAFKVVLGIRRRMGLAIQRAAREHEDCLLIIRRGRSILYCQAGR